MLSMAGIRLLQDFAEIIFLCCFEKRFYLAGFNCGIKFVIGVYYYSNIEINPTPKEGKDFL
jgi:hypothetical protein